MPNLFTCSTKPRYIESQVGNFNVCICEQHKVIYTFLTKVEMVPAPRHQLVNNKICELSPISIVQRSDIPDRPCPRDNRAILSKDNRAILSVLPPREEQCDHKVVAPRRPCRWSSDTRHKVNVVVILCQCLVLLAVQDLGPA